MTHLKRNFQKKKKKKIISLIFVELHVRLHRIDKAHTSQCHSLKHKRHKMRNEA